MIHMNLAKMQLLPLMSLFVLMWTGQTFADGPTKYAKEDDEVILSCFFGDIDMTDRVFDWKKDGEDVYMYRGSKGIPDVGPKFTGRVTHFSDPLKSGNVSIRIKPAKTTDSGTYTCIFPDQKAEKFVQLKVDCILKDRRRDKINGTCPMPALTTLSKSTNSVLIECMAVGAFPQPEIELQNKNKEPIPVKDLVYFKNGTIILIAEVTNEDYYSCVVRQRNICHGIRSKDTLLGVIGSSGVIQLSSGLLLLPLLGLLELFSVWPLLGF